MSAEHLHHHLDSSRANPGSTDIEAPRAIAERVASLARELGKDLESAIYFEHPFTPPGLLLVVRDEVESFPDLLACIYRVLPSGLQIACLRRRELFELALPGFAAPPLGIDEQPHLANCVKFRSALLHGRDCRPEVPLPADPGLFLRAHIRDCRRFFRSHAILALLVRRRYQALVEEIAGEARRLMSIALAGDQGWEVDLDEVPACFAARYGSGALRVARCSMLALRRRFLHPLASFLHDGDLSAADQQALFARLGMISKGVPVLICAALGRPVDEVTAITEMGRLLPDVDFGILDEIVAIRRGERSWGGSGELKSLLRRLFDLLEPLHQTVLTSGEAAWRDLIASPGQP